MRVKSVSQREFLLEDKAAENDGKTWKRALWFSRVRKASGRSDFSRRDHRGGLCFSALVDFCSFEH